MMMGNTECQGKNMTIYMYFNDAVSFVLISRSLKLDLRQSITMAYSLNLTCKW